MPTSLLEEKEEKIDHDTTVTNDKDKEPTQSSKVSADLHIKEAAEVQDVQEMQEDILSAEQKTHLVNTSTMSATQPLLWFYGIKDFRPFKLGKHPFFDVSPRLQLQTKMVDYVLLIPPESSTHYKLDLPTGLIYKSHSYCAIEDVWRRQLALDGSPPYAQGFIPRTLDSQGGPLKIYVFGRLREMEPDEQKSLPLLSAKVIGGLIEQYCEYLPCMGGQGWSSRTVLIGVSPDDPDLKDVQTLLDLKMRMNWDSLLGYMENLQGHVVDGERFYPTYRIVNEMSAKDALKIGLSEKNVLSKNEWKGIQKGCLSLYEWMWNHLGNEPLILERSVVALKDLEYWKKNKMNIPLEDRLSIMDQFRSDYLEEFFKFVQDYLPEAKKCVKYVYYGDAKKNDQKFWLMTFLVGAIHNLDNNFLFDCTTGRWIRTYSKMDHEALLKNFYSCSYDKIQNMFTQLPFIVEEHKHHKVSFMNFVEYDMGMEGTHQPIYNWIKKDPDELNCLDRTFLLQNKTFGISPPFPTDVIWQGFKIFKE
jgi:hypothetical protein